jgi:hypothetical protein
MAATRRRLRANLVSPGTARAAALALGVAVLVLAGLLRHEGAATTTSDTSPAAQDPGATSRASALSTAPGLFPAAVPEVATAREPGAWEPRSIRGRLLFPDGTPAADEWIRLGSVATRPSRLAFARSFWPEARTGADGSFALTLLDDATYFAVANVERADRRWQLRREVEPGPDEVTWTLEEGRLRLRVLVLDPDGVPVDSASVHLVIGGQAAYAHAFRGVAVFHDFPDEPFAGAAGLVAQLFPDEGPMIWAATAVPHVDLDGGETTVRCLRGDVIEGRVAPGTDGRVPEGTIYARAAGGGLRDHISERKTAIGAGGAFRFETLSPGPWALRVMGPLLADLTESVVAHTGETEVVLRPYPTATVRVRVVDTDGRSVEGATVRSHLLFEEDKVGETDAAGVARIQGVRPGVPRSLWAVTREDVPRSASLNPWLPEDTTLTVARHGMGDAALSGIVKDTTGKPVSFVAVWGRQGDRVTKMPADEAGRFRLEHLQRGPVTLEVRLASGWDQPESMEIAAAVRATAPAEDVPVVVDLGATLLVRFPNWPFDVDREGAVLIDEANGAIVRPAYWTWAGARFARLDPRARYTLFTHATATDLFAKVPGIRANADVAVRLVRGLSLSGKVLVVGPDDETAVVGTLFGVDMEADVAPDGRFEIRGVPPDEVVDIVATAVGPGGAKREARARALTGESGVDLVLGGAAAEGR